MARISILALALSAALSLRASAKPWTLADCNPADQPKYDRFAQLVRAASPGSTVYVPKPFPTSEPQVIEDFLYQYKGLHRERADPRKLPPGEPVLAKGIMQGTVTYTVQRVENWSADRCGKEQRRDFFHLIRVLDAASGVEIARVTLSPSGLLGAKTISIGAPVPVAPLPQPEAALREVAYAYQLQGDSPEYVVTIGAIYCGFTSPCLAFRHGDDAYIFVHERPESSLFRVAAEEPRLTLNPSDVQARRAEVPRLSANGSERLLYLSGSTWAIARKVARP